MSLANAGRAHKKQTFFIPSRIFVDTSLRNELGALERLRILSCPDLPVGQVRDITFEITMLVAFGNARAFHAARGAFAEAAVARYGKFPLAILPRDEFPARSLTKLAIFEWHLPRAYGHVRRTASRHACGILLKERRITSRAERASARWRDAAAFHGLRSAPRGKVPAGPR